MSNSKIANLSSMCHGTNFNAELVVLDHGEQQLNTSNDHVLIPQRNKEESTGELGGGHDYVGVPHDMRWDAMYERLVAFKEKHGHCLVPNRHKDDPKLGAWVSTQRRQRKAFLQEKFHSTILPLNRIERLDAIGFVWNTPDPRRKQWDIRFEQLRAFYREHGHSTVPIGYKANVPLANWVSVQRQEFSNLERGKSSKITKERIALLNLLNFTWKAPRGARPKSLSSSRRENFSNKLSSEGKKIPQGVMRDDARESSHYADGTLGRSQTEASQEGLFISRSLGIPLDCWKTAPWISCTSSDQQEKMIFGNSAPCSRIPLLSPKAQLMHILALQNHSCPLLISPHTLLQMALLGEPQHSSFSDIETFERKYGGGSTKIEPSCVSSDQIRRGLNEINS